MTFERAVKHNWQPVPYSPELGPKVRELCRRTWGDIEIADAGYQRWQYDDNPAGRSLSTFTSVDDHLVGQFGVVPLRVAVDGDERLAGLALNVVTDEAYRGRGIFPALGRAADAAMADAGVSLAFALPNENSFPGFVRDLGYTHAGDVPFLVRPLHVRRLVRARLRLPGLDLLAAIVARPLAPPLPQRGAGAPAVAPVQRFDGAFDAFWATIRERHRVAIVRDAAYLNWRFRDVPIREYRCLAARDGDAVLGYIVLREAAIMDLRAGLVVDFVASDERAGAALLEHALASFRGRDLDLIASLMLPHTLEYGLLRRSSFRALPRPLLPQRFRVVVRDGEATLALGNWFLTMGDYDAV